MAMNARELLLIVRATNQASGALRRVGNDLQSLGRHRQLALRQNALALRQQAIARSRMSAVNELESVTTGRRAQNMQIARNNLLAREAMLQTNLRKISTERTSAIRQLGAVTSREEGRIANAARQRSRIERNFRQQASALPVRIRNANEALRIRQAELTALAARDANPLTMRKKELQVAQSAASLSALKTNLGNLPKNQAMALAANADKSAAALGRAKVASAAYARTMADLALREKSAQAALAGMPAKLAANAAAMNVLRQRAISLEAELSILAERERMVAAEMLRVKEAMRVNRWDNVAKGGAIMNHLGRVATMAGVVVGASFLAMAHSAAKFNTEATLAATQVAKMTGSGPRGVATASRGIQRGILGIMGSGQATASSTQQTSASYDIFSSLTLKGSQKSQVEQGMALLKQFNKASIAGAADLKSVTTAGITLLNNFSQQGKQAQDLPKLLNRMFAAVRYGRMTVDEFVGSMSQVAPSFSTAFGANAKGFDQLAGAMATITRYMPKMGSASAGLSRFTDIVQRPDFIKGFKTLFKMDIAPGGHLVPLNELLKMIDKAQPKLKQGGVDLLGFFKKVTAAGSTTGKGGTNATIQARRALQLLVLHMGDYQKISHQVVNDNNEFTKSFESMRKTPEVQWKAFVQQLHSFAITIGEGVIPALTPLGRELGKLAKSFNSMSQGTKSAIGKWGLFIGVGTLVLGIVMSIGGSIIRMLAVLGRMRLLWAAGIATFIAVNLILAALQGHLNSVSDAIDAVVRGMTDHGIMGWVLGLGLAATAAYKLSRALRAVGAASLMAGGAGATGGVLGAFMGGGRRVGNAGTYSKVLRAEGAGRMAAMGGGLSAAFASIGPQALLIVGAVVATAGAALLWENHMRGIRKHNEEVKHQMQAIEAFGKRSGMLAGRTGGLGGSVKDHIRAVDALQSAKNTLRSDRKSGASASTIREDYLNIADAVNVLYTANAKVNQQYNAFNGQLNNHGRILEQIGKKSTELKNMTRDSIKWYTEMGMKRADVLASVAEDASKGRGFFKGASDIRVYLQQLERQASMSATRIRASLGKALTGLSRIGPAIGLPRNIDPRMRQDIMAASLKVGRMPTLKEIKAIIKAEVDPASLRHVSSQIRNAVLNSQSARNVAAGKDSVFAIKPKIANNTKTILANALRGGPAISLLTTVKPPNAAARRVKAQLATFFSKKINQPIHLGPVNPNMATLGAEIANGIALGVTSNAFVVNNAVSTLLAGAYAAGRTSIQSKSPSKLFARGIGKPMAQGISVGFLNEMANVQRDVGLSLLTLGGTYLQNRMSAIQSAGGKLFKKFDTHDEELVWMNKHALKLKDAQRKIRNAQEDLHNAQRAIRTKKKGDDPQREQDRLTAATDRLAKARERLAKVVNSKPITSKDLIKDLYLQVKSFKIYNAAIQTLDKNKRVPRGLIAELRAMGADGAKLLQLLANSSDKDLKRIVKLWKQAQKEINKSKFTPKQSKADLAQQRKDDKKTIQDYLMGKFNSMLDANRNAFGQLLSGPKGIMGIIQRNAGMKEQLTAAFGALFDGLPQVIDTTLADIQTKVDWGQSLNMTDLQLQLSEQVKSFKVWSEDINTLVKRGAPQELVNQLQDMGPQSKQFLDILAGATDSELKAYIITWKESQKAIDSTTKTFQQWLDPQMVIDDLQLQRNAFDAWANTLQSLRDQGLPEALVQQLQALGIEAEPALMALNKATSTQLTVFSNLWVAAQNDIFTATQNDFNAQLNAWYNQGIDVAQAIIRGTIDELPAVVKAFEILADEISRGYQGHLKLPGITFPIGGGGGVPVGTGTTGATDYGGNWTTDNIKYWFDLDPAIQAAMRKAGTAPKGFAMGGVYSGSGMVPGSYKAQDSVNAHLEPGELVLSRSELHDFREALKSKDDSSGGMHFHEGAIQVTANSDESLETTLTRTMFRIRNRPTP